MKTINSLEEKTKEMKLTEKQCRICEIIGDVAVFCVCILFVAGSFSTLTFI